MSQIREMRPCYPSCLNQDTKFPGITVPSAAALSTALRACFFQMRGVRHQTCQPQAVHTARQRSCHLAGFHCEVKFTAGVMITRQAVLVIARDHLRQGAAPVNNGSRG
ncbi:hypothetical protein AcW1_007022 [Taiwanofungus camphoratus]|nr:hypothetical protein AcW1_007022 [Antrodia cinnamomea]